MCAWAEHRRADFIATLNKKDFPKRQLSARVITPDQALPTRRSSKKPNELRVSATIGGILRNCQICLNTIVKGVNVLVMANPKSTSRRQEVPIRP